MYRSLLVIFLSAAISISGSSQNRYFTKTGTIKFTAGTPVEDIEAINKSLTSVFDVESGKMEFAVLIKGFEFKRGLMQEHFNENYLESEKFPKATFKGQSNEIPKIDYKINGKYPMKVKGILTIHNVSKEIEVIGNIMVNGKSISAESSFDILLEDYSIKIPSAVKDKISPVVKIHVTCDYKVLNRSKV